MWATRPPEGAPRTKGDPPAKMQGATCQSVRSRQDPKQCENEQYGCDNGNDPYVQRPAAKLLREVLDGVLRGVWQASILQEPSSEFLVIKRSSPAK